MDVTGSNFQSHLPSILAAISRAHFVSFDLEFSGIPGKQKGSSKAPGQPGSGKQTLQERYEETRRAAERYQILQLGLTCVEEERDQGLYVLRTYNFFLNPVPEAKLDIERELVTQAGAMRFLRASGFSLDALYEDGVPYFSREEEARARAIAAYKSDRKNYTDISITEDDNSAIEFVTRVRREIKVWKNQGMPNGYINIAPVNHSTSSHTRGLNGFQKRLVHQIIRSEFPDIVSIPKPDFVQLLAYDRKREEAEAEKKNFSFEKILASQVGLRWVVEGLCPSVNDVLPPEYTPPKVSGDLRAVRGLNYPSVMVTGDQREAYDSQFDEILAGLSQKMTVIVGHNLFIDLIYFYNCFFGRLPDRVEDFQDVTSKIFAMVFDTKYLADKINDNSASYNSSLQDLDRELSKLTSPVIEVPPEHSKYFSTSPAHEAGFDSFLTAKVLIRLAAQIGAEAPKDATPPSEDDVYVTAPEQSISDLSQALAAGLALGQSRFQRPSHVGKRDELDRTVFSHTNPYAALQDQNDSDDLYLRLDHHGNPTAPMPPLSPPTPLLMPHGESEFWRKYGNRLRVNGTVEEVCEIRPLYD